MQDLNYGTSAAKSLTVSFWVRSYQTGTFVLTAAKSDSTAYYNPKEYTINASNTWEHKTLTFSPTAGGTSLITSSNGAIPNDNGQGMHFYFMLNAGSNYHATNDTWATSGIATSNQTNMMSSTDNHWSITGLQIEAGDQATDFEYIPFDVQLQRCQRYYQQIPHTASGSYQATPLWGISANVMSTRFPLPVVMRTNPTGGVLGTLNTDVKAYYNGGYQTLTNFSVVDTTDCSIRVDAQSSGAFAANAAGGIYIVTTSGRLTADAEF